MRARTLTAAAVAVVLAVSGCTGDDDNPSQPAGTTKVTFVTGVGFAGREAPVYVAIEKGYFADAGLAVTVQPGKGTEENIKMVQSEAAQFVSLDITGALIAYGKNKDEFGDFVITSALQQANLACLMALEGSGITSPRDLAGKTVGFLPGGGGVVELLFDTYAKLAGFDPNQVRKEYAASPALPKLLAAGKIHASAQFVVGRGQVEADANGRKAVVLPYSDYLTNLYGVGVGVGRAYARDYPDVVRRFNQALARGLEYAIDHHVEAGQIYAKHRPNTQPTPAAAAEVAALTSYVRVSNTPVGGLDEERLNANINALYSAGAIPFAAGSVPFEPDDVAVFDLAPKS